MQEEVWIQINGYNGCYYVSNLGRVKSSGKKGCGNFILKDVILKPSITNWGYNRVVLQLKNKRKHERVHRLVALYFIPNPYNKPDVNHINGIKTDNRACNLEWVTPKENYHHAINNGLRPLHMNITGINQYTKKSKL